jgi:hypothetical protein
MYQPGSRPHQSPLFAPGACTSRESKIPMDAFHIAGGAAPGGRAPADRKRVARPVYPDAIAVLHRLRAGAGVPLLDETCAPRL